MDAIERGWRAGVHYYRSGLTVLGRSPWLYVQLLTLFAIPALIAAIVAAVDLAPGTGRSVILFFMNGVSSTVAPVVIMVAVAAGFSGHNLGVAGSLWTGLRWLPRYLWTNAHTTIIFWAPVGTLLLLFRWQRDAVSLGDAAETALNAGWFAVIGAVALYIHSRTLLAPFYAIHGDMPATVAALESWRVSGRYFGKVFGTFIVSSAPTAVPLGAVVLGLLWTLGDSPRDTMIVMLPSLTWVALKFIRPFLVTAMYPLHKDLWREESGRRAAHGDPGIPAVLDPFLRLSAWIPRVAGRIVRKDLDWTL